MSSEKVSKGLVRKGKWEMIKEIIKAKECILVVEQEDCIAYKQVSNGSELFKALFNRVIASVGNCHREWLKKNSKN